jgi:hypothetical protein
MLIVTTPADDLALAPIEALRAAAGVADDSRDDELTALGLRIAAEITDACGIVAGQGGEPTLRRETLTETFSARNMDVLVLSRRHAAEIVSVTDGGEAITLDDRALDGEAGLLEHWIDGRQSSWCNREIVVVYEAGFDIDEVPTSLVGVVTDMVRIRLSEGATDPLEKSRSIELPDVETVRIDRWVGSSPGASHGLPADILARLSRFINTGYAA